MPNVLLNMPKINSSETKTTLVFKYYVKICVSICNVCICQFMWLYMCVFMYPHVCICLCINVLVYICL